MDGYVTIGTKLDSSMIDKQINLLEDKLEGLIEEYDVLEKAKPFEGQNKELLKLGNEIDRTRKKLAKLKQQPTIDFSDMGNGIQKVTRRIGKMALAVFGIRSAFMFVRNAINTIAADDEQLKADIDYMKSAIAYTLEPVVRGIVNLAKQLMFYVGYIIKAWTGINIFENANKSLKGANQQAKALSKQLAGFDEMNVLSDSSSASGGGVMPSFDLSQLQGEVPWWIDWIAKNKDTVIAVISGITAALISMKLLGLDPILSLGIGIAITGIILLIKDVIKFIKDPSWNNFANILKDLAIILAGVAVAMLAVNAANPIAWILLAIAVVAALAAAVIKHWNEIKTVLGKVGSWIYDHIIKPIGDFFTNLWNGIVNGLKWAVDLIKNAFNNVVNFFRNIVSNIINLFREIGIKVGDVISGAFKGVVNGVLWAVENILNTPIRTINSLIRTINKIPGINIGTLGEFRLPRLAKGGIINQPGRGIPVGSAIGGERGQEGVIPLTDSQQMALLGKEIGRYITVNANITNTMNGRVISRELQKVQNDSNFAFNR
jgi:hypothetical protein